MATTKATLLGHRSATSFSDLTLSGDLTVSGTTTTIDTEVVVSDATVINNAGSDVGLKINSTSSGNIMQLQDGGSDVMVVADGGNVTFSGGVSGVSGRLISVTYVACDSTSSANSGNYTKPAGCTALHIIITGGGGAGGKDVGGTGGGGGAGATTIAYVTESSSSYFAGITAGSGTIAYSVGHGGANSGNNGDSSWFGTDSSNYIAQAGGGYGGNSNGTASGTASGAVGTSAYAPATHLLLKGGKGTSEMGDGGSNIKTGGKGGASYWGEGGSGANENTGGGENAHVFGTGGGGASGSGNGGSGLGGVLVIYAYT